MSHSLLSASSLKQDVSVVANATTAISENGFTINISVLIIVDRDNLKKIIIGKNGSMLKKIGTEARIDLEEYLGSKVYLSLYVKTIANWRDREKYLQELGLKDDIDFE